MVFLGGPHASLAPPPHQVGEYDDDQQANDAEDDYQRVPLTRRRHQVDQRVPDTRDRVADDRNTRFLQIGRAGFHHLRCRGWRGCWSGRRNRSWCRRRRGCRSSRSRRCWRGCRRRRVRGRGLRRRGRRCAGSRCSGRVILFYGRDGWFLRLRGRLLDCRFNGRRLRGGLLHHGGSAAATPIIVVIRCWRRRRRWCWCCHHIEIRRGATLAAESPVIYRYDVEVPPSR